MLAAESEAAFRAFAAERGLAVPDLDAATAVATMIGFYRDVRADRTSLDADGDALLFEWGTYAFGAPASFQIAIVRQFIEGQTDEEQGEMSQLHLTVHFEPDELTAGLAGNTWCWSPDDLAELEQFIESGGAMAWASANTPSRVEFYWSLV